MIGNPSEKENGLFLAAVTLHAVLRRLGVDPFPGNVVTPSMLAIDALAAERRRSSELPPVSHGGDKSFNHLIITFDLPIVPRISRDWASTNEILQKVSPFVSEQIARREENGRH
jgi:hypothetical protein